MSHSFLIWVIVVLQAHDSARFGRIHIFDHQDLLAFEIHILAFSQVALLFDLI